MPACLSLQPWSLEGAALPPLQARSLLPGLPTIDDRVLRAAEMGIFQNMLFGGLGSDMVEVRAAGHRRWLCDDRAAAALHQPALHAAAPRGLPRAQPEFRALKPEGSAPRADHCQCPFLCPSTLASTGASCPLPSPSPPPARPQMAMVQQSQRDVELMRQQVQAAASWAQPNLAAYQQQEAALGAQVDAKKGELQAFRRQALAAALAAGC